MSDLHEGNRMEGRDLDLLEELGYEPTDEAVGSPVGKFTVWFFVFLTTMVAGSWIFFTVFGRVNGFKGSSEAAVRVMPPEGTPLLQGNIAAQADMEELRKVEHDKLESYQEDPQTGKYRIPIEKAMEIVVKRGLPTRNAPGVPEDAK